MTFLLQSVHMALVLELTQREVQCAWVSKCPHHSLPQQPENIIGSEEDPLVKDRHFINLSFHQFFIKVLWPGDQEACGSDFGTTWFKLPVCSQTLSRYCSEQKKIKIKILWDPKLQQLCRKAQFNPFSMDCQEKLFFEIPVLLHENCFCSFQNQHMLNEQWDKETARKTTHPKGY